MRIQWSVRRIWGSQSESRSLWGLKKSLSSIQGFFTLDISYLVHMLIFVLFDENPQYLHQRSQRMIFIFANGVNQIIQYTNSLLIFLFTMWEIQDFGDFCPMRSGLFNF